jgi:hypothetical protein
VWDGIVGFRVHRGPGVWLFKREYKKWWVGFFSGERVRVAYFSARKKENPRN